MHLQYDSNQINQERIYIAPCIPQIQRRSTVQIHASTRGTRWCRPWCIL